MADLSKVSTRGRLKSATRIVYGHYYVTPDPDGSYFVFDDRNPDGRARLTDGLSFDGAVKFAHAAWTDEEFGQGRTQAIGGTNG